MTLDRSNRSKTEEKRIIIDIEGTSDFRLFLLTHNITIGTVFSFNYSPRFSKLISISLNERIVSIRKVEFDNIKSVRLL